jgi:hypothetical protein
MVFSSGADGFVLRCAVAHRRERHSLSLGTASVHESEAPMRRSMTETFEAHDASTPEAYFEVLQVYVGIALIVLGVLLTGITVLRVMSL